MRVLVTGGAGFIGSHVTDALLARGDEVAVLDDVSSGRAGRLDPQVTLYKLSITDAAALTAAVQAFAPELICHLAAQIDVRASVDAPADDAQINILGTVNLLEAARAADARVLFSSSGGALYGRDAPIPSREDVLPLPESPYGVAKYCAEQYVGLYNRLHGTRHSVLRLANVYGPRLDPAGDAVQAFLRAGDNGRPGTWNIGAGVEVSVLDLVDIIGEVAGREMRPTFGPPRAGELQRSAVAAGRAASELGWRAATPLAEGVRRVYRWIEAGAADRAPC